MLRCVYSVRKISLLASPGYRTVYTAFCPLSSEFYSLLAAPFVTARLLHVRFAFWYPFFSLFFSPADAALPRFPFGRCTLSTPVPTHLRSACRRIFAVGATIPAVCHVNMSVITFNSLYSIPDRFVLPSKCPAVSALFSFPASPFPTDPSLAASVWPLVNHVRRPHRWWICVHYWCPYILSDLDTCWSIVFDFKIFVMSPKKFRCNKMLIKNSQWK